MVTLWIKAATIAQLLCGTMHFIGFFFKPKAESEEQKQLYNLMQNLKMKMGPHQRTLKELMLGQSAAFTLLYIFGGALNFFLLNQNLSSKTLKGILLISTIIFGICFILQIRFTIISAIIPTCLAFIFLLLALITV
jgi:hypothetical protein